VGIGILGNTVCVIYLIVGFHMEFSKGFWMGSKWRAVELKNPLKFCIHKNIHEKTIKKSMHTIYLKSTVKFKIHP
jgi:hypothetical protein